MTTPLKHRMGEACLFLTQKDPLKRSDMAPSRGKLDSNAPDNHNAPMAGSSPPRAGIRRPLSPVREFQVVKDVADSSEGSEKRTETFDSKQEPKGSVPNSPTRPISADSSGCHLMPPPLLPINNEQTAMETSPEEETTQGAASSSFKSNEFSGPQHEVGYSVAEEEARCAAFIERNKMILLQGLSLTCMEGNLTLINLSRRGLIGDDAKLINYAMKQNPHLCVLKLSYNNLGDEGAATIASGFVVGNRHHKNLSVLDLGFNGIGDDGCAALSLHAVAGNHTLRVLYLSGNNIGQQGTLSLSGAMLHGCRLTALHLSANRIGNIGIQAIARAVAENEACKSTQTVASNASATIEETMEELYLGEISMAADAFVPIPSMLLTNLSLRVLCLSNTGIDDQSMALLAQALSRNKNVPLESVQLSFNEITCAGVECFMNAVWGSKTLRELKLDNNNIRDRGAQLAAVALTSIDFEVLDLGFNRVTTVGIKALMKSISETTSLESLTLSGIPLDATACKAVSYALAYNCSLREVHVDNCQVGYSGQRHIVAGIVSNRWSSLRVVTGFDIGAIAVTLQLPQLIEPWSNDKVLRFIHFMWTEWNRSQDDANCLGSRAAVSGESESKDEEGTNGDADDKKGPAAPATVVRAAKQGLILIGNDLDSSLHTEPYERGISETSPVAPANATMLERTQSGTIRVPPLVELNRGLVRNISLPSVSSLSERQTTQVQAAEIPLDPMRKNKNLEWLRAHFRSLNEVSHLPFNSADLWQLHQYFFSPILPHVDGLSDSALTSDCLSASDAFSSVEDEVPVTSFKRRASIKYSRTPQSSPMPMDECKRSSLDRNISFQALDDAVLSAGSTMNLDSVHKRRPTQSDEENEESEHASKRARNFKPRIAYYPRIREKLEALGTKPSQEQTLSLLRLLKFVESVMFKGKNQFDSDMMHDPEQPSRDDVEMIILDLL